MDGYKFRKYLAALCGAFALLAGGLLSFNWAVDPLQFYRKADYPPYWSSQKRYQNPGIARNYQYEAAVIGTSVSQPLSRPVIETIFGESAINFSMEAASGREQRLMVECVLRPPPGKSPKSVSRVFWEMSFTALRGPSDWVSDYDGDFPAYFYDANPWNEIPQYLLNLDTTKRTLKVILGRLGARAYPEGKLDDLDWRPTATYGQESIEAAWERAQTRRAIWTERALGMTADQINANFDENILPVLERHSEVQFHLYFPPFSVVFYEFLNSISPHIIEAVVANRQHIFEQTRALENVQLSDFQALRHLILDFDGYSDPIHFGPEIGRYLVSSMAEGRHLATQDALDDFRSWVLFPERFSEQLQLAGWAFPPPTARSGKVEPWVEPDVH
jgi:hypothetical protein